MLKFEEEICYTETLKTANEGFEEEIGRGWAKKKEKSRKLCDLSFFYSCIVSLFHILILMSNKKNGNYGNLFVEVMEQFSSTRRCDQLFKKAQKLYQTKLYKISKITGDEAIESYQKIHARYVEGELNQLPNDWYKNQRKIFNWFIICFCDASKIYPDQISENDWEKIGKLFHNKSSLFAKFQGLSIFKKVKKISWSTEYDEALKSQVRKHGINKWNEVSKNLFFSNIPFTTPKQCRQRWFNHVNDELDKGEWRIEQDYLILDYTVRKQKKWSKIVELLKNHRTEHMIKNRYYALLHKQNKQKTHDCEQKEIIFNILTGIKEKILKQGKQLPTAYENPASQYQSQMESQEEEISEKHDPQPEPKKQQGRFQQLSNLQGCIFFTQNFQNPPHLVFSDHSVLSLPSPLYNTERNWEFEGFNKSSKLLSVEMKKIPKDIGNSSDFLNNSELSRTDQSKQIELIKNPSSELSQEFNNLTYKKIDKND